jgi:hypothetical protein
MLQYFKSIPFFLFLLPVFFCLHGVLEIYGGIYFSETFVLALGIYAGMAMLYLLVFFILKNSRSASIICFYISLLYLFFGAMQDWILDKPFLLWLHKYSVLLPVLAISIFCLAYLLKKNTTAQKKIFLFLNFLLIIYCVVDAALLLNKSLDSKKTAWSDISFDDSKVKARPNVYYLLFDEYPGYKSLQTKFGFQNDSLYHFLQGKGFKILPSVSNYNLTFFSMSAIFNMQYVDSNFINERKMTDLHDYQQRFLEIKNGEVFDLYKSMGYQIENYSVFDIGDEICINAEKTFLPKHSRALIAKMLHHRLIKNIGWWFNGTMFQKIFSYKEGIYYVDETNFKIEKGIKESLKQNSPKPKFLYAHFLMPHPPYFRDSSGALLRSEKGQVINTSDKKHFLPYLKYTNSFIGSLVSNIVQQDPSAIIVVMSDHGFRDYEKHTQFQQDAFDNICAVKFPDNNFLPYNDSLNNVNFFRYVFNCEYGQQIPYLKNNAIWLNY